MYFYQKNVAMTQLNLGYIATKEKIFSILGLHVTSHSYLIFPVRHLGVHVAHVCYVFIQVLRMSEVLLLIPKKMTATKAKISKKKVLMCYLSM